MIRFSFIIGLGCTLFFLLFGVWAYLHDTQAIWCVTRGAHIHSVSKDGNFHETFWCVKNGRVVK